MMTELNPPEKDIVYDASEALEFFKLVGTSESLNAEDVIFAPGQKSFFSFLHSDKMYLLTEGRVEVKTAAGKTQDIKPGNVFGKHTPFAADDFTATAKTACKLMTLTEKQFLTGLKLKPEFLLMLMGLFVMFLRKPLNTPETEAKTPEPHVKKDVVLSAKMLKDLVQKLGDEAVISVPPQRVIFKEGGSAMLMYVILEGTVLACLGNKVVNRCGPGDVIGEIALVDQKPRTASVVAETHGSLLAINRQILLDLIQSVPGFGIALLRVLASRAPFPRSAAKPADDMDWD